MAQDRREHGEDRYELALRDFDAYLASLQRYEDPAQVPAHLVPGVVFCLVNEGEMVAGVRLRLSLNAALEVQGGHIGYDVRPSARRQGFGSLALRLALEEASCRGLGRVLLTVDDDNHASIRIIEKCGGALSGGARSPVSGKPVRHYWIELQS
ncbi:MAG TPA: GNAT family N-acetyltransferase [Polyangiaceae bacterium]|nr:GNAT family N-acetyltransferase [Polyangiaceae bacterium]